MWRTICFLKFVLFTLLFAIVGHAFQPYIQQQHSYRISNILDKNRRRLVQLFYAPTDPSIIEHNRQYLSDTLGFSKEKLDKLEDPTYACTILTREIGVLEKRVSWLKKRLGDKGLAPKIDYLQNRLLLDDNSLRKLYITAPALMYLNVEDNIEPKLDWIQERLALDQNDLSTMIKR